MRVTSRCSRPRANSDTTDVWRLHALAGAGNRRGLAHREAELAGGVGRRAAEGAVSPVGLPTARPARPSTGAPAPSSTRPASSSAPGLAGLDAAARRRRGTARRGRTARSSARESLASFTRAHPRRRVAPAQHDVEAVAERPVGAVSARSNAAISRSRARSGTARKIGSSSSSGSPGKYICVTSRVANAGPNTEKCRCAGRHALAWFCQG